MVIKIVKTSLNGYLFSCLEPRPNATHGHFYRPFFVKKRSPRYWWWRLKNLVHPVYPVWIFVLYKARKYKLKSLGYDFEKVNERISILFKVEKDYITRRGRQKDRVRAWFISTLTLHKIWVQNAIDWVIKGCLAIFKDESVLNIHWGLENGQTFLDGLI